MKRQKDEENRIYSEPRCHEGNHGMVGLLVGARQRGRRDFAARKALTRRHCVCGACGGFAGGFADEGE